MLRVAGPRFVIRPRCCFLPASIFYETDGNRGFCQQAFAGGLGSYSDQIIAKSIRNITLVAGMQACLPLVGEATIGFRRDSET